MAVRETTTILLIPTRIDRHLVYRYFVQIICNEGAETPPALRVVYLVPPQRHVYRGAHGGTLAMGGRGGEKRAWVNGGGRGGT